MKKPLKQFDFLDGAGPGSQTGRTQCHDPGNNRIPFQPDLRIVLLRGFSREGFSFFTNYQSRKGEEMAQNKKACLNFFWPELQRQVRIAVHRIARLRARAVG
jgi:pyridoxamine 5'-phosphate oxidase